ncbi:MAG: bifunctional aspartate kinase/homoserine dehydrogenase I, partial [Muribaculaceae bacterium]|nr:bifunctional aspartate kinase/homoserine dehydrogenase I [Muribaculaceae bacterium]
PIYIKNTFNPSAPGTRISDDTQTEAERKALKGISSISDTCLITIAGEAVADSSARIFNEMARNGVGVFLVSQADNGCMSFAVRNADAEITLNALREEFATEIQSGDVADIVAREGLATVAVIGVDMKQRTEVTEGLYDVFAAKGVNVVAGAPGASELNMSFVVELDCLKSAIAAIHDTFFAAKES